MEETVKLNGVTLDEKLLSLGLEFINEKLKDKNNLSSEKLTDLIFDESIKFVKRFNGYARKQLGEYDRRKKLTNSDIEKIKDLYKQGLTCKEIAKQFGVSGVTISFKINPKVKNKHDKYNKNYNQLPKRKTEKIKEYTKKSNLNTLRYKKELCAKGLI